MDFGNSIGQELDFKLWTFILKIIPQIWCLPKCSHDIIFVNFAMKSLDFEWEFYSPIMEIQTSSKVQFFQMIFSLVLFGLKWGLDFEQSIRNPLLFLTKNMKELFRMKSTRLFVNTWLYGGLLANAIHWRLQCQCEYIFIIH